MAQRFDSRLNEGTPSRRTNNRKRVIVHKQIQLTFVRRLMLHWGIFVAATCLVTTFIQFLLDPLQSGDEMGYRFRLTVGSTLLVAMCFTPIFIRDTVKLSHRVVGPLIRLRGAIQAVDLGNLQDESCSVNRTTGRANYGLQRDAGSIFDLPVNAANAQQHRLCARNAIARSGITS